MFFVWPFLLHTRKDVWIHSCPSFPQMLKPLHQILSPGTIDNLRFNVRSIVTKTIYQIQHVCLLSLVNIPHFPGFVFVLENRLPGQCTDDAKCAQLVVASWRPESVTSDDLKFYHTGFLHLNFSYLIWYKNIHWTFHILSEYYIIHRRWYSNLCTEPPASSMESVTLSICVWWMRNLEPASSRYIYIYWIYKCSLSELKTIVVFGNWCSWTPWTNSVDSYFVQTQSGSTSWERHNGPRMGPRTLYWLRR